MPSLRIKSVYTFCDAPDSIWPDKSKTINNQDVIDIISKINPLINYLLIEGIITVTLTIYYWPLL